MILWGYFKLCFDNAGRSGLGCSVAKAFRGIAVALGKQMRGVLPEVGKIRDHSTGFCARNNPGVMWIIVLSVPEMLSDVLAGGAWSGAGLDVALGAQFFQKINLLWAGSRVGEKLSCVNSTARPFLVVQRS